MCAFVAVLILAPLYACNSTLSAAQPSPTATPVRSTSSSQPSPVVSSSPAPSAAAKSQLHVAGNLNGDVTNIKAICGQKQVIGNGYTASYLSATGLLNGNAFLVNIYDPAGPGSWEGRLHLYVRVGPPTSHDYTWLTQSSRGISDFISTRGVKVAAPIPGRTSSDIQAGGLIPTSPITMTGQIVCSKA